MELYITTKNKVKPRYLKVEADVRYWEDAIINGESCEKGEMIPFKNGDSWEPLIDIIEGVVVDWPKNTTASFHFKVCDTGSYHLLDDNKNVIASILNNYVPAGLCHGDNGYGDYIIFKVNKNGSIENYKNKIDPSDWCDEE